MGASDRPLHFIPLPPLSGATVFADEPQYKQNPDVARFVSHLGGHARSFAVALKYLQSNPSGVSYRDLNTHLLESSVFRSILAMRIPKSLLVDCLLRQHVGYMEPPCGSDLPYSHFVAHVRCLICALTAVCMPA